MVEKVTDLLLKMLMERNENITPKLLNVDALIGPIAFKYLHKAENGCRLTLQPLTWVGSDFGSAGNRVCKVVYVLLCTNHGVRSAKFSPIVGTLSQDQKDKLTDN